MAAWRGGGGKPLGSLAPGPLETKLDTNTLRGGCHHASFLPTQSSPTPRPEQVPFSSGGFGPQKGKALAPSFVS